MTFFARLDVLRGKIVDFLFPPHCVGCKKEGEFLCLSCRNSLPRLWGPFCSRCGRPLSLQDRCPSCERWRLAIDGIRSPFRFEGVTRQAIHQFKYNNFKALAIPLARLLKAYLEVNPLPAEVLVPVPLHPRRLRERGYNQSSLLARELGKLTGLPVAEEVLLRSKDSPAQARAATAEARRSNVAGAFLCRHQELFGKQVLLIDDVCTTGATLDSCAIALRSARVVSAWGLTVAREV